MSIEKLTGQVMADSKASAIYSSLDNHIPPGVLASDYKLAVLDGDKSLALAIELFVRQLAITHLSQPSLPPAFTIEYSPLTL